MYTLLLLNNIAVFFPYRIIPGIKFPGWPNIVSKYLYFSTFKHHVLIPNINSNKCFRTWSVQLLFVCLYFIDMIIVGQMFVLL